MLNGYSMYTTSVHELYTQPIFTVGIPITTLYGIEMLRMVVIPGGTLARRVKE